MSTHDHNGNGGSRRSTLTNEHETPRPPRPAPEDMGPEVHLDGDAQRAAVLALAKAATALAEVDRLDSGVQGKIDDLAQRLDARFDNITEGIDAERRRASDAEQSRARAEDARSAAVAAAFVGMGDAHNKLADKVNATGSGHAALATSHGAVVDEVRGLRACVGELMTDLAHRKRAPAIGAAAGGGAIVAVIEVARVVPWGEVSKFLSNVF
jgi:hypothetical protein